VHDFLYLLVTKNISTLTTMMFWPDKKNKRFVAIETSVSLIVGNPFVSGHQD